MAHDWKPLPHGTVFLRHAVFDRPSAGERARQSASRHLFTFHADRQSLTNGPLCSLVFRVGLLLHQGISFDYPPTNHCHLAWCCVFLCVFFFCQFSWDVRANGKGADEVTVNLPRIPLNWFAKNKNKEQSRNTWLQPHYDHLQPGLEERISSKLAVVSKQNWEQLLKWDILTYPTQVRDKQQREYEIQT